MDTTTVLEIIKMIDNRVSSLEEDLACEDAETQASIIELENFRDHLQSFIEAQVNALENRTEQ
jgi:hypothetical protein